MRLTGTVAILLCALGCDINGNDQAYPGASVYEAPDKSFHFHFPSPPWRYHAKEAKHLVYLVVDNRNQFQASDPISISHKLWISYNTTNDLQAGVQTLRNDAISQGRIITRDPEQVTTLTGEQGQQFWGYFDHETGRFWVREALLPDANNKAVRFSMLAAYPLDDQDIHDLIESFSAGPDPGSETPPRVYDFGYTPGQVDGGAP